MRVPVESSQHPDSLGAHATIVEGVANSGIDLSGMSVVDLREKFVTALQSGGVLHSSKYNEFNARTTLTESQKAGIGKVTVSGMFEIRMINGKLCFLLGKRAKKGRFALNQYGVPAGKRDKSLTYHLTKHGFNFETAEHRAKLTTMQIMKEGDVLDDNAESAAGAACREHFEETGMTDGSTKISIDQVHGRLDDGIADLKHGYVWLSYFLHVSDNTNEFVPDSKEMTDWQWVPLRVVADAEKGNEAQAVIEYLNEKLGVNDVKLIHGVEVVAMPGLRKYIDGAYSSALGGVSLNSGFMVDVIDVR